MFCLCVMHSPGLAWSESEEGKSFSEWAKAFFAGERDSFEFMQEPENHLNEVATAIAMNPGGGALWKPQIACSVEVPQTQTMKSAKPESCPQPFWLKRGGPKTLSTNRT